ncbi:MAG: patatin-like phospholipase family protein [Gemmataceae bacterium]|nr:patatin-like phospholipase family protein [Gemmataceae bacterium]MCI0739755.1 patatin-like phospholipase family protein [Gemmataceae bacterium]
MPRLGLALSGGGFRATLYHLGVVRFLRDADLLSQVTHIASVSGGSILAAHLVLNWKRYTGSPQEFDAAAEELLKFSRFDVRNHIVRRVPMYSLCRLLLRLGPARWRERLTMNHMLRSYYEKHLYGKKCVHQLPEQPELHILATNVSEGALCSFTRTGLIIHHRRSGRPDQCERLPARLAQIALAVAASSAFPGFFPLVPIHADDIGLRAGEFPSQTFTDGVYDNLGVRAFEQLKDINPPLEGILVSDAGAPFQVLTNTYLGIIGRSVRASDILWDRVWELAPVGTGRAGQGILFAARPRSPHLR